MASTINAKNTSTGLVMTPDATGQLELQTADTTRMTIDVNGNVGVGTTSPTAGYRLSLTGGVGINIQNTGASDNSIVKYSNSGKNWYVGLRGDTSNVWAVADDSAFRMVVDNSGNVGIGTASPSGSMQLLRPADPQFIITDDLQSSFTFGTTNGYSVIGTDAGYVSIKTGVTTGSVFSTGTERMRIDASGNVLIGRTSTGFDKTAYGWQISRDAESFVTVNTAASCITFNRNNNGDIFKFFRDGTQRGWISVETTGTTYGTASDKRFKENFADAPEALSKINNVKVQSFDWKEGGHTDYGFVAQDLNKVLPFAVTVGDDGEEVEKAWGVDNSKIVPVLVKAIQELKAELDTVKAELAELKGVA